MKKNKTANKVGLKDFKQLKERLSADSQLSQLVSADDVINSIEFLFTLDEFRDKFCKCKKILN